MEQSNINGRPAFGERIIGLLVASTLAATVFFGCSNPLLAGTKSLVANAIAPRLSLKAPDSSPIAANGTLRFPDTSVDAVNSLTLRIENAGKTALAIKISGISIKVQGDTAVGTFSLLTPPSAQLAVGESSDIVLSFYPTQPGSGLSATVTIPCNDPAMPNFSFTVQGTGLSTGCDLTEFDIKNAPGSISGTSNPYSITLLLPTSLEGMALGANFSASPGATVTVGGVTQASGETNNVFPDGSIVAYTVTSQSRANIKTYDVTVTYNDTVPLLGDSSLATLTSQNPTTASSGGTISADGGPVVTQYGICWGTSTNPTIGSCEGLTTVAGAPAGYPYPFTKQMTSLSTGTLYHVRAYATNSKGSGYGSDSSFTTFCGAPDGIGYSCPNSTAISLAWSPTTGASSYKIYRSSNSNMTSAAVGTSTSPSYTDTGLSSASTYYYIVTAVDPAGESYFTTPMSDVTAVTATLAPTGLCTGSIGTTSVALSWTAPTGASGGYNIYRSTNSGTLGSLLNGSPVSSPSYTDTTASVATSYYYSVKALNSDTKESPASSQVHTTTLATVPTGLGATSTATSVCLSWSAQTAGSFKVYCSTSSTCPSTPTTSGVSGASTSATISGLNPNAYYYLWVSALNSAGAETTVSAPCGIWTTPGPPSGLSVSVVPHPAGSGELSVSWSAVSGATSYVVSYGTTSSTSSASTTTSGSSPCTLSSLANFTPYYVWVQASNSASGLTSAYSAYVTASPGIHVTGVSLDTGSVTLPTNAGRQLVATIAPSTATITGMSWTSSDISVATVDSTGSVTAKSIAGNATITATSADQSKTASCAVTVYLPPATPAAPSIDNAMAKFNVSWTAASNATSYSLYYNTSGSTSVAGSTLITTTSGTSAAITGLSPGQLYYLFLVSHNSAADSGSSSTASAHFAPTVTLQQTIFAVDMGNAFKVTWSTTANATSYDLSTSRTVGVPGTPLTYSGSAGHAVTCSGQTVGTVYVWLVTHFSDGTSSSMTVYMPITLTSSGSSG